MCPAGKDQAFSELSAGEEGGEADTRGPQHFLPKSSLSPQGVGLCPGSAVI